jgi:L-alanine-DL-glutamate epimerase-like enolase superfamily enzyme
MTLMLDATWSYSYAAALAVGSEIEELGFLWYEDPLPALDIPWLPPAQGEAADPADGDRGDAGWAGSMAIDNCDWFEVLPFNRTGDHTLEHLSYGVAGFPVIDSDGEIHAPAGPGLGVDADWELINASVTQIIS